MLRSHVAEAEEFLSTPYTALVAQLPIHPLLPVDSEPPRSGLSQRAHALCHADQYVHKGDVFDVHLRATIKSGGVFLKLSNGRGWVAELTPLGEKIVGEATLTPCTDIFRVLSESLRYARARAARLQPAVRPCGASRARLGSRTIDATAHHTAPSSAPRRVASASLRRAPTSRSRCA